MNCNGNCNKLCPNYIISQSVTVVAIDGVDTLVIDIPAGFYRNGCKYCIIIAQSIPAEATVTMPVAVSIGGDTTTVYPLVCSRNCLQAVACQVSTRTKYCTTVQTNATSGVFKVLYGLGRYCPEVLSTLPIPAPAGAGADAPAVANVFRSEPVAETSSTYTRVLTNTTKEVITRE